ncbi:MAG: hypothetical protein IJS53_00095 [Clostridia bacterium]|nr:hypothetical protein [Clostridia bacterium]
MSVKQVETLLSVGDMFGLSASSDLGSQGKFMLFAMMKRTGLLIAAAVCLIAGVIMKNSAKNK